MVIPPNNIGKGATGAPASQSGAVGTRNPSPQSTTGKESADTDAVSLSPEAKKLAKLEASVKQNSGVDEARVSAIRDAINNGQYSVDSQSISKKMMDMDSYF